jgi:homospermidine synthase
MKKQVPLKEYFNSPLALVPKGSNELMIIYENYNKKELVDLAVNLGYGVTEASKMNKNQLCDILKKKVKKS